MGLMELRQIPNLKLSKPEDHPTWLECLNRVGADILKEAGQQVATSGAVGWSSVVVPLAYQLKASQDKPKHTPIESLPDCLEDLPDGHPLKPKART